MASISLVDLVDIATGETNLPSVTKMEISQVIQVFYFLNNFLLI